MVLILAIKCLAAEAYRSAVAPGGINNFGEYEKAAQRLNDHHALYMPEQGPVLLNQHVSSPLIPLLLRPIALLPFRTAFCVWVGLNIAILALAMGLYCWGVGLKVFDDAVAVLLILFTGYRYWPTVLELAMGNVDLLLLLLLCGMYVCDRFEKWIWMGVLAAVAGLTKTWMIGIIFYLIARRKWLAAFLSCLFFAAGIAAMFALIGWRELPQWLAITRRYSQQPLIVSHSVAGMARIYFATNPLITPLIISNPVHMAALVIGYGILVVGLLLLFWRGSEMSEYQGRLCLGLTALALVLGNSVSHQYYFVLALPLIWTLLIGSANSSPGWIVRLLAFLLYLVFSMPSPGDPLPAALTHGIRSIEIATTFVSGMLLWGLGLFVVISQFPPPEEGLIPVAAIPEAEPAKL
jgi:hypothetical protein